MFLASFSPGKYCHMVILYSSPSIYCVSVAAMSFSTDSWETKAVEPLSGQLFPKTFCEKKKKRERKTTLRGIDFRVYTAMQVRDHIGPIDRERR